MKISMINHSDLHGGAARAAWRIHKALLKNGFESKMFVEKAISDDWSVINTGGALFKGARSLRSILGRIPNYFLNTTNPILHSTAILPSTWPSRLNKSDTDIVHLHWINSEMMSIRDIAGIRKPIVWTLHDMWAFCGAEHYSEDMRWKYGYTNKNRPSYESGFDLNQWVWNRKIKHWKHPFHIVTPSKWLSDCARQSVLMRDWPISVIPNAIDTDFWQPVDKKIARNLLNLPIDCPLLVFGAMGGGKDPRKGIDLLLEALKLLQINFSELELVIFGESAPLNVPDLGFRIHYTGHLHDDLSLRILYSAADAMIIPSRQDNLPNTGVEALSCGTPVIAFDTCGLPDIVVHNKNGWLARAFDTEHLAEGIRWILSDQFRNQQLSYNARIDAINRFSYKVVASEYSNLYKDILDKS